MAKISVASREQGLSLSSIASSDVPTALVCWNNLLRAGIRHLLSGTRFVISDDRPDASAERPRMFLICEPSTRESALACIEQIRADHPDVRIVLIAEKLDTEAIIYLWRAGVNGFCRPNMEREALINALELVASGETSIPSAFLNQLMDELARADIEDGRGLDALLADNVAVQSKDLSARETQILRYLMKGATNKLIAQELGLSEATIKVHVKAVLKKTNASNRTQAATWATANLNTTSSPS
ncbi:LuxR C-terminal-related transcriptional regulator [Microvirga sp. 2YAF29]|uniref:LuxR C-terminal-related transcriptional regulator n=1 Tax=Microvirga sp. 2YAF29 TaxID=3233031 RepID=UPI003F97CC73